MSCHVSLENLNHTPGLLVISKAMSPAQASLPGDVHWQHSLWVKCVDSGAQMPGFRSWVDLGKRFKLSGPPFPHP